MITVLILLIATYILNLIDYAQTIYAISYCGLGVEYNPIARFFFDVGCAGEIKLIVFPIILVIIGILVKLSRSGAWMIYVLFIVYFLLILHNFAMLMQMGLLF